MAKADGPSVPRRSLPLWPYDGTCSADRFERFYGSLPPVTDFVLKVQSRCNLDCSYCYVYHSPDQSWRTKPARMSLGTLEKALSRIRDHASTHGLRSLRLVLHGGEPMLNGVRFLTDVALAVRRILSDPLDVLLAMQTNGTLLDETSAEALLEHRYVVGVSIDGPRWVNDLARLHKDGSSSFQRVDRALRLLSRPRYAEMMGGVLCVVDPRSSPADVLDYLCARSIRRADFLLPHRNWDSCRAVGLPSSKERPSRYGEWMAEAFDLWWKASDDRFVPTIRLFDVLVRLLNGAGATAEALGLGRRPMATIDADGSFELVDNLKTSFDGAPHTGLTVDVDSVDDYMRDPGYVCAQMGLDALPAACHRCDAVAVCGGGMLSHRFSSVNGFRNRSSYCSDLYYLIGHARQTIREHGHDRAIT